MGKLITLSLLMLICVLSCGAYAETWTAFTYEDGNPLADGCPSSMVFSLHDNQLSLNSSVIATIGGSSAMTWTLMFSGQWAVCGSIDEFGAYLPDPYASFVQDGEGGYIEWANNTPSGYQSRLLLGQSFVGDGSATYTSQWGSPLWDVSGSLVLNTHPTIWGSEYNLYEPLSHTFMISNLPSEVVPEPAGMTTLFAGLASLLGIVCRRKSS